MGTRLFIQDDSIEKICEVLGLAGENAELYRNIQDLEDLILELEESEVKQQIELKINSLCYATPALEEIQDYIAFGFGRVNVGGYFEKENWYDGSTSDPKIVKSLLKQVGQKKLVGKVKAVSWG